MKKAQGLHLKSVQDPAVLAISPDPGFVTSSDLAVARKTRVRLESMTQKRLVSLRYETQNQNHQIYSLSHHAKLLQNIINNKSERESQNTCYMTQKQAFLS